MTLTSANSYTGGTIVNQGILEAAGTDGVNNLGTGTITVNAGGILKLSHSNVFGNGAAVGPAITLNGGVVTNANSSFNSLGAITLNGGTRSRKLRRKPL